MLTESVGIVDAGFRCITRNSQRPFPNSPDRCAYHRQVLHQQRERIQIAVGMGGRADFEGR